MHINFIFETIGCGVIFEQTIFTFFSYENASSSEKTDEVDLDMHPIPFYITILYIAIPLYIISNKEEYVLQIT